MNQKNQVKSEPWQAVLESYHQVNIKMLGGNVEFGSKLGVPYYPDVPQGAAQLLPYLQHLFGKIRVGEVRDNLHFIDATYGQGIVARALSQHQKSSRISVYETSRAALQTSHPEQDGNISWQVAPIWHAPAETVSGVCLVPPVHLGTQRVYAELAGAYRSLEVGGQLLLALPSNKGAKRYENYLKKNYAAQHSVLAKKQGNGWRISLFTKNTLEPVGKHEDIFADITFKACGITFSATLGVFAAGKLDKGTEQLLHVLEKDLPEKYSSLESTLEGKQFLDIGCGYGVLSLWAARAGARVVALDNDILAVNSTKENARANHLDIDCRHSDIDSALSKQERKSFDYVVMNPPFHVGEQVVMDLSRAFVAAAAIYLKPTGKLYLVANQALPYETWLAPYGNLITKHVAKGFKVLVWSAYSK